MEWKTVCFGYEKQINNIEGDEMFCRKEDSGGLTCSTQCEDCKTLAQKLVESSDRMKGEILKHPIGGVTARHFPPLQHDMVNKPPHYHKSGGTIDIMYFLEQHYGPEKRVSVAEGFCIGNIHKYTSRYDEKGGQEDLEKANFYLNKLKVYKKMQG